MTLLVVDGDEVVRVYSSDEVRYPIHGRKPILPTPWRQNVIEKLQAHLATDRNGIRLAFFDHVLMASMGIGSAINLPVVYDGRCLGSINLNAAEHHYDRSHVSLIEPIAPLLIPAFLAALDGR